MGRTVPPALPRLMPRLLVLHCRPGFEKECAAEICHRGNSLGHPGFARTEPGRGYVVFEPYQPDGARALYTTLPLWQLIFTRQWFLADPELRQLPTDDRITPMVERLAALGETFADIWIETPDTNEGKSLSRLARKLAEPLRGALAERRCLAGKDNAEARAHVLLTGGHSAYAGCSLAQLSAPSPQGIPRLRLPRAAPSRAVLKLEEALLTFLTPRARESLVCEGRTAVDLGAAPGGWTWLLVRDGLQVTAVDNGDLIDELARSPQVEHRRADGFNYRPERPVHWLVCDMVEQPGRVARLAASWFARGWCERALFNLKLPMKRRFDEVQRCLQLMAADTRTAPHGVRIRAKQLYHDREEVTVYLAPEGRDT